MVPEVRVVQKVQKVQKVWEVQKVREVREVRLLIVQEMTGTQRVGFILQTLIGVRGVTALH